MAELTNSKRRPPNRGGKMFMPLPFGVNVTDEGFFTFPKLLATVVIIILGIVMFSLISKQYGWSAPKHATAYIVCVYVLSVIFRYGVLEESYYYRLYKKMKENRVSAPSVFWDIASITDSQRGTYVTYSNLTVGVFVKLYRATTAGKPADFEETHYNALSDFYNFLNANGYKFVQMNVMESASKDKRLSRLDDLVNNPENENLKRLMDIQTSHIKAVSRVTLYETEYLIIRAEKDYAGILLDDLPKAMQILKKGAFSSYDILDSREIGDLFKEMYGVRHFDAAQACLRIFGGAESSAFKIVKIYYADGSARDLEEEEARRKRGRQRKSGTVNGVDDDGAIDLG
jgi:hypothetical protein